MCKECWELIAKADDTDFLDSLELTNAERAVLEELYKQGENRIVEILELQGKALHDAILELSEELLLDIGSWARLYSPYSPVICSLSSLNRPCMMLSSRYIIWQVKQS